MRLAIVFLSTLCCSMALLGATPQEDEQDRQYTLCLAKRKVDASTMTSEDVTVCLREAGIEDPGEAARQETQEAWHKCVATRALEFDDGVSPARDVARAIVPLCANQWRALAASMALPPRAKRRMAGGLTTYGVEDSVRIVLGTRRAAKVKQSGQ